MSVHTPKLLEILMKKKYILPLLLLVLLWSCSEKVSDNNTFKVGVFIPGVTSGNPTYEAMAKAGESIASEYENISVKILEAGHNQAQWQEKLTSFISQGNYDVVVTTNPALPEICDKVSELFSEQKFIVTDAYYTNNKNIATFMFNQYEQSYVLGYAAALISESDSLNTSGSKRIGFIVAQEFPLFSKHILPGFLDGAKLVDDSFTVDYRVIGNWTDSSKALEIAKSMIANNIDVTAIIAGNAGVGAMNAYSDNNKYIVFHNTDEYAKAEGSILLSGFVDQYRLVRESILNASQNNIDYGSVKTIGIKDGYIEILNESEYYKNYMPEDIQEKVNLLIRNIKNDAVVLSAPSL